MEKISFIVEGDEDVRFLQDFVNFHFSQKVDNNSFIIIGGKSETIHLSRTKIQTNTDSGNLNVLIFDADDNDYQSTLDKIKIKSQDLQIHSIYLFPDNQLKGNLESLLKSSVPMGNEKIFSCIDDYATCKDGLKLKRPRTIDEKEKLWIYHGSFSESGNAKGSKRNYQDADIWDLNSDALNPLKEFLKPFFT